MPTLSLGEFYFATDINQVYVGTMLGNLPVMLNTLCVPNGKAGQSVSVSQMGTAVGPADQRAIVAFAKLTLPTGIYWVPLMQ